MQLRPKTPSQIENDEVDGASCGIGVP